jgi:hypothetical protein
MKTVFILSLVFAYINSIEPTTREESKPKIKRSDSVEPSTSQSGLQVEEQRGILQKMGDGVLHGLLIILLVLVEICLFFVNIGTKVVDYFTFPQD